VVQAETLEEVKQGGAADANIPGLADEVEQVQACGFGVPAEELGDRARIAR
jgi:hypothetical protein